MMDAIIVDHAHQNKRKLKNYNEYCINDKTDYLYKDKCPINVRASIYYNYIINSNKLNDKYELINSGNKIKFYYCKDKNFDVVAFKPGLYPDGIIPEIDNDIMFAKTVLVPINSILEAIEKPLINDNLTYDKPLV